MSGARDFKPPSNLKITFAATLSSRKVHTVRRIQFESSRALGPRQVRAGAFAPAACIYRRGNLSDREAPGAGDGRRRGHWDNLARERIGRRVVTRTAPRRTARVRNRAIRERGRGAPRKLRIVLLRRVFTGARQRLLPPARLPARRDD